MKPRQSFRRILPAAALAPLVLTCTLAPPAFAANWQGDDATNPNDWNTAENWNTGVVPGVGATVGEAVTFAVANDDIIDINGSSVDVGAFSIGRTRQTFANSGAAATITCTSLSMGVHNQDHQNHIFNPNVDINGTFIQGAKNYGLTFNGSLEVDTLDGHLVGRITTYGPFTINDPDPIIVSTGPNHGWGGGPTYNLYDVMNCNAGMTLTSPYVGSPARINAYAADSLGGITGPLTLSTNSVLTLNAAQTTYPSGNIEIGPYALLGGDTGTATWGPGNNINVLNDAVLAITAGSEPTTGDIGTDVVWKPHTSGTTTAGADGTTIYKGISIGNFGLTGFSGGTLVTPAGTGDAEVLVLPGLNHNNNNFFSIESSDQTGVANFHCRGTLSSKGFRINQSPNANSCTTFNFIGEAGGRRDVIANFYYNGWNVYSSQTYNFSGAGAVFGEVKNIEGQLTFSDDVTFDPQQTQSKTITRYDGTKLTFNDGAALLIDADDSNLLESLDTDQVVVNGTPYLVLGNYAGAYNITAAANPRLYDFMAKSHVCIAENNNNIQNLQGDGIVLGDGRYLLSANLKGTKTLNSAVGSDAKLRGVGGAGTSMGIACETGKALTLNIPIDGNGADLKLNNDTEMTLIGGNLGVHWEGRRAPQIPRGTITLNSAITNVPSLTVLNGNVNLNAGASVPSTMDLMVASGATLTVNTPVTANVVGGNGTVSNASNLTFDTIAPGGSVGSLNLGSFTMPVDAIYACGIGGGGGGTPVAGTDHDLIKGTTVSFAGGWNLQLENTGLKPGDLDGSEVFTLIDANSIVDFTEPTLSGEGFDFSSVSFSISNGDVLMTGLLFSGGTGGDYDDWAAKFPDADLSDPDGDFDGDGLSNDYERIFGLNPASGSSSNPISVPLVPATGTFSFTRRDPSLTKLAFTVWTSTDLEDWAQDSEATLTPGAVLEEVQTVAVQLGAARLGTPRLFVRIKAEELLPPPPLLSADFEDNDGGFTIAQFGTGSLWQWGDPESQDKGGGAVTTGAGGSGKCWGINLTDAYVTGTDTALRSPVLDLTAVTGASLSFARAIDALAGHTLEVNVIDATTDAVIANVMPATGDPDDKTSSWGVIRLNLPETAYGQTVRLEWRFRGLTSNSEYLGAYLDNVLLTQTP